MAKKEPTNAKKVESIIVEGFKEHKPTLQSFWHKGCIIGENGINTNTKAHARKQGLGGLLSKINKAILLHLII
jgi:Tat protein secretion system quality control protein TatD with DNase activity